MIGWRPCELPRVSPSWDLSGMGNRSILLLFDSDGYCLMVIVWLLSVLC